MPLYQPSGSADPTGQLAFRHSTLCYFLLPPHRLQRLEQAIPWTSNLLLNEPYAIYSKYDPQTAEANKDYSMTSPLAADGSDYPCKSRCTSAIVDAIDPVATLVSGSDFTWNLAGTAVHNGGSCQVGVSYDYCSSMVVIASWIGGCPLSLPYTLKIPELPGSDKAVFWWSWTNEEGNREIYQNAAVVAITGTADTFVGPTVYRVNSFSDGSCVNTEGIDDVYPAPGDQVFYGGKYDSASPPSATSISGCTYDYQQTLTVSNGGGGSGPTATAASEEGGSSGSGSASGGTTTSAGATATAPGGSSGAAATTAAAAGTAAGTAAAAGSSSSETTLAASGSSSGGGSTSASGSDASSGSGASTTSSSSDDHTSEFLEFALGAVALVVVAGVVICLLHRRSTSPAYSRGGGGGAYEDDESSDSDTGSSDDDDDAGYYEKRRRHHHGRRG
ncbi:hypothetical protein JCM5296_001411 [Sporobolomyces johnsonii]